MCLMSAPARAHGVELDGLAAASLGLVVAAAGGYALGIARLARAGHGARVRRIFAFGAGLAALAAALAGPLEAFAARSLAAHMGQHMLLVAVAAPLLVLGAPLGVIGALLPREARKALARGSAALWSHRPLFAFVLHGATIWVWHAPALYQAALRSDPLHVLEHATLLASALYFWWSVVRAGRGRTSGFGAGALLALATMMHTGLLGALIAFAPRPLYPLHARSTDPVAALADQQLAGLLMWVPGGAVYLAAGLMLVGAWLRRARPAHPGRDGPRAACT